MQATPYCEILVTIYHTALRKAETYFGKILASTVKMQPTVTFENAALRRCSHYQSIGLHIVTFQKSEIPTFAAAQTAKSPFTHRSSANFHYLLPLSQRLETSVFLCSENDC
jgi:hypothetical protein